MKYQVSIIIPVFGKWNYTQACLKDLFRLNPERTEIIVIDNASQDNSSQELEKLLPQHQNLQAIFKKENLGFGKANNYAYQRSDGDNIIFLNNDIRVKDRFQDWTTLLLDKCQDNQLVSPTGGYVDPNAGFQFRYETRDPQMPINYLSGWCLAGKRSVFDKLMVSSNTYFGPFNEAFKFYYEDTDLSFRATAQNIKLVLQDIPVIHFGKISSRQLNISDLYLTAKETFLKKWSK